MSVMAWFESGTGLEIIGSNMFISIPNFAAAGQVLVCKTGQNSCLHIHTEYLSHSFV